MAEGLARKILGGNVQVESAGTHAHPGDPPPVNAVRTMLDKFLVDTSSHRSRSVDHVHIENFDYVVPMADNVREEMKEVTADRILKQMQKLSVLLKKQ